MKVMFACLADHASADQMGNKLNINGVFDRIGAQAFPAQHMKMFLVFRLIFEHEDNNRGHKVRVTLRDEDHRAFAGLEADIQSGAVAPGDFVGINQILELTGITFPRAGRYHFEIQANDEEPVRVPFAVTEL